MKPKVSIVIPIYNVEKYLQRCLDSVINQTYKNIEIILVNDGSTDNSFEICKSYKDKDNRILLIDQKNKGLSGARNAGIKLATGDYICFIDPDDWVELDYIYFAVEQALLVKAPILVLGYFESDENTDKIANKGWLTRESQRIPVNTALFRLIEDVHINSHAWDKLFEKRLFDDICFPVGKTFEDIFIMHAVFDKCEYVGVTCQPKYHYYCRSDSIARSYKTKNILDYFEAEFIRLQYLREHHKELCALQNTKLMELLLSYYPKFSSKGCLDKNEYHLNRKQFDNYINTIIKNYAETHTKFTDKKFDMMYKVFCVNREVFKLASPVGNNLIKRVQKFKYKDLVKSYFHKSDEFVKKIKTFTNRPKYVLIGVPEYDNLGDIAIGYAEKLFLQEHCPNSYEILFITENNFWKYFKEIKKCIIPQDIIFIQGGGNLGNQYYYQDMLRRKIISNFNNRIIIFPSTFYLTDLEKNINEYAKFYSKSNISIFVREKVSYTLLRKYFKVDVQLVPDIVLSLPMCAYESVRNGIALCLRNDVESRLSRNEKDNIKKSLCTLKGYIFNFDTCIHRPVSFETQKSILESCWKDIASYELVVTDKLHAMIFCVLTNTPCVVLGNYNHKIKGVYEWLEKSTNIVYVEDISEINAVARKLIENPGNKLNYNYTFDVDFDKLKRTIEGEIINEKIY